MLEFGDMQGMGREKTKIPFEVVNVATAITGPTHPLEFDFDFPHWQIADAKGDGGTGNTGGTNVGPGLFATPPIPARPPQAQPSGQSNVGAGLPPNPFMCPPQQPQAPPPVAQTPIPEAPQSQTPVTSIADSATGSEQPIADPQTPAMAEPAGPAGANREPEPSPAMALADPVGPADAITEAITPTTILRALDQMKREWIQRTDALHQHVDARCDALVEKVDAVDNQIPALRDQLVAMDTKSSSWSWSSG